MKKILLFFIFILLSIFIISCKNNKNEEEEEKEKEIEYKEILEYIYERADKYIYSFYSTDGAKLGDFEKASNFYKGYTSVKPFDDSLYYLIDQDGARVSRYDLSVEPIKNNYLTRAYKAKNLRDGDNKYRYALADYKGNVLTDFLYSDIEAKHDVFMAYTFLLRYDFGGKTSSNVKYDILSIDGKTILKDQTDENLVVTDSFIIYYKIRINDVDVTIYDKKGKEISQFTLSATRISNIYFTEISDKLMGIKLNCKNREDNLYYVSNLQGNDAFPGYRFIEYKKEDDILIVQSESDSNILKYYNNKLEQYLKDYDNVYYYEGKVFLVKIDDLYYQVDSSGKKLYSQGFDQIFFYPDQYIMCYLNDDCYIFDLNWNLLFQFSKESNYMIYYNKEENIVYYKVDEGINASFYEVQDNVGVKIITLNNGIYNVYNHYLILKDNKRGDKVYDLKTKQTLLQLPIGYSISFYNDRFYFASSGDVYHKIYYNSDLEEILTINLGE